jgi:ABC-type multidrug transport system ATPase subunit
VTGQSVLLTSHSLVEVQELCDRLAIMVQGKIVASGTPAALRNLLAGVCFPIFFSNERQQKTCFSIQLASQIKCAKYFEILYSHCLSQNIHFLFKIFVK